MFAGIDAETIPDRESKDYLAFLEGQIQAKEHVIKKLRHAKLVEKAEEKLRALILQCYSEEGRLTCHERVNAQNDDHAVQGSILATGFSAKSVNQATKATLQSIQREEKEKERLLSKLKPDFYLPDVKTPEKMTYRELVHGMVGVLQFLQTIGHDISGYSAHMSFVTKKAALNIYVTEALGMMHMLPKKSLMVN